MLLRALVEEFISLGFSGVVAKKDGVKKKVFNYKTAGEGFRGLICKISNVSVLMQTVYEPGFTHYVYIKGAICIFGGRYFNQKRRIFIN